MSTLERSSRSADRPDVAVPTVTKLHRVERCTGLNRGTARHGRCPVYADTALDGHVLCGQHFAQALLSTDTFRVYTNDDVVGCELAGALKNVMAIAAGMADGMGFGDNSKAALITRGLAELTRLGVAMGGNPLTFAGLAGMGDLVATCISPQSRNRHVGHQLGQGRVLAEVVAGMNMVAEGVKTAPSVLELAGRHDVEVPIVEQVVEVLSGRKTAREIIPALMRRQMKSELHGLDLADVVDRL